MNRLTKTIGLIILMCLCTNISAFADTYKNVSVVVNGERINIDGIIKDSRTLVPVRGVFEKLGYYVTWEANTKIATFNSNEYLLTLQNGNAYFKCKNYNTGNEAYITPDVPQQIIDGHFYIPLRAVSEAIGAEVGWDRYNYIASVDTNISFNTNSGYNANSGFNTNNSFSTNYNDYSENKVSNSNCNSLDLSLFKSSTVKSILKEKNIISEDALDNLTDIQLQYSDLTSDFFDDLKHFKNLTSVYVKGKVDDLNLIKNYLEDYKNEDIVFYLDEENFYSHNYLINDCVDVKYANISEKVASFYKKIDYENMKKSIIDKIIKKGDSDYDKILAIHDYIVKNTKYDFENFPNNTIPQESYDPYYLLKNGRGVCAAYAGATKALLDMAGITTYPVTGTAYSFGNWGGHAWLIVKLNNNYYHLDPTWDDPVGMGDEYYDYDYFLKSDDYMSKDHRWEKSEFPACNQNYDHKNSNKNEVTYENENSLDDEYSYDKLDECSKIYDADVDASSGEVVITVKANEYTKKVVVTENNTGDKFTLKDYDGDKNHVFKKVIDLDTGRHELSIEGRNYDGVSNEIFTVSVKVENTYTNNEDVDNNENKNEDVKENTLENYTMSGYERIVFDEINNKRVSMGLKPFEWNKTLKKTAKQHCKYLESQRYSSYDFLTEACLVSSRVYEKNQFDCYLIENVAAYVYTADDMAEKLMNSEINSCKISDQDLTQIGIECVELKDPDIISCIVLCFDN